MFIKAEEIMELLKKNEAELFQTMLKNYRDLRKAQINNYENLECFEYCYNTASGAWNEVYKLIKLIKEKDNKIAEEAIHNMSQEEREAFFEDR